MKQLAACNVLKTDMEKLPGAIMKAKTASLKAQKIHQHRARRTNWFKL
jgi:hypothetical protein